MKASPLSPSLPSSKIPREYKLDESTNEVVSSNLDAIPFHIWDDAAASLLEKGIATVRLATIPEKEKTASPISLYEIHSRAFRSARRALDAALYRDNPMAETDVGDEDYPTPLFPMIAPEADSAHATGFHHAGGMSRYNVRREGIVFSDDQCSCNDYKSEETNGQNEEHDSDLSDLSGMFWSLHGIADRVLLAIETKLELELSGNLSHSHSRDGSVSKDIFSETIGTGQRLAVGWFQQHMGPTETASQWHMKRFVIGEEEKPEQSKEDVEATAILRTETGERISLPMHTDPSLISVVIHDSHGDDSEKKEDAKEAQGALGLQYYHPKERRWEEPEAHGHLVATVFVGSVLAHLTCGKFPAAKHRVVETREQQLTERPLPLPKRMAATLFVRPQPSAMLQVPLPSPWLLQQIEDESAQKEYDNHSGSITKKKKLPAKKPITFDTWLKRVAKNYEKQKKKQKNKIRK